MGCRGLFTPFVDTFSSTSLRITARTIRAGNAILFRRFYPTGSRNYRARYLAGDDFNDPAPADRLSQISLHMPTLNFRESMLMLITRPAKMRCKRC